MKIRLYEQPDGLVMLAGIPYRNGVLESIGWKWSNGVGCPGGWHTRDPEVVERAAIKLGLPIEKHPAWPVDSPEWE